MGRKGSLPIDTSLVVRDSHLRLITMVPVKNMFLGEFQHILDTKGRLAIPAKFRTNLALGAVVTRGFDSSLILFPLEEWGKLASKIASLPLGQVESRAFARLLLSGAADVSIDRQGRIIIPEYLRTWAKLEKEVVVAGLYNRIEIWNADLWYTSQQKAMEDLGGIAEKLSEYGI